MSGILFFIFASCHPLSLACCPYIKQKRVLNVLRTDFKISTLQHCSPQKKPKIIFSQRHKTCIISCAGGSSFCKLRVPFKGTISNSLGLKKNLQNPSEIKKNACQSQYVPFFLKKLHKFSSDFYCGT